MAYIDKTLQAIHEALVNGQTTPLELTMEAIRRAEADGNTAFETIVKDQAIKMAASLTIPEPDNVFWGVPFAAKDNFSTIGIETSASSHILDGYVPLFDATVITRLKDSKAILIGKTTLDELAMGGSGTTGRRGPTFNPHDPSHQRMIGGSSSGSAAAVAAGIVPFALGSDTGDSVRKPAGYAGLVGFKPTWGRISRYGLFPFAPSLDHVGYLTRSVVDSAHLTALLAGRDDHDATSAPKPVMDYVASCQESISGMRVAIIHEIINSKHDEHVLTEFDHVVTALKSAGAIITNVHMRQDLLDAIYPIYITLASAEATSNDANLDGVKFGPASWGATYDAAMRAARTSGFSELIKRRFIIGSFALMRDNQDILFIRAQKGRRLIVEALQRIYKEHDIIIAPAAPSIAPRFEDKIERLSSQYLIADNHLVLGNLAGLPSLTLPIGMLEGMPFGLNVMGRPFEETSVLRIAAAIERATGLINLQAAEVSP